MECEKGRMDLRGSIRPSLCRFELRCEVGFRAYPTRDYKKLLVLRRNETWQSRTINRQPVMLEEGIGLLISKVPHPIEKFRYF
jgi:hypothetical protein